MTRFIALASSKGGTGKTTVALNLGLSLTNFGRETVVVDTSFHAPHIGMHLGSAVNPVALNDALNGKNPIADAVYTHISGLKIVPLHLSSESNQSLGHENLSTVLQGLKNRCEAVLVDAPSGMGKEVESVIMACEDVILVTTPDILSATEALKTKKLAERLGRNVLGVVVNRARHDSVDMHYKNIEALLGVPVLEIIPEDDAVRHSLHMKHPVSYSHPDSKASVQFKRLAAKLIGERYVDNIEKEEKQGLFEKILKSLGLR